MKSKKLMSTAAAALLAGSLGLQSCTDTDGDGSIWDDILGNLVSYMFGNNEYDTSSSDGNYYGWLGQDENTEEIEDDISLSTSDDSKLGATELPSKVDLTDYLPPIGDQGSYGTCVGWAVAYNCRTFLWAKQKGLSKSSLTSTSNQFSPKDLFWSIDDSYKGEDCNGTSFEYAFDVLVSRGCATMSKVPYTNMGDCSKASTGGASEASSYKIKSYREIDVDKATIKKYLAQGHLVVFGAKLGDEFMYSSSSAVLTEQTSFTSTGIHAYHAMVCAGYDDSKGSNGAFRVVNSWGDSWGDDGYIWVDEDFFTGGDFAYCAFVAYNNSETEVDSETNSVADDDQSDGYDLLAYELTDEDYYDASDSDSDEPRWRTATYSVYNSGSETISSSKNWGICLLAYNAYDASDYTILLLDFYTDLYDDADHMNGDWANSEAYSALGVQSQGYAWNNFDIKAGQSVSEAINGADYFEWSYKMPEVTGSYYLVLFADAFGSIDESDEDNNFYYVAQSNGDPLYYQDGILQTASSKIFKSKTKGKRIPQQNEPSDFQSVITSHNVNAYSTDEISAMIRADKKSGALSKKAAQWMNSAEGKATMAKAKKTR